MRANLAILWILAVFFLICAVAYSVWHLLEYNGQWEWVGTIGMALSAVFVAFVAVYLQLVHKSTNGTLPEDLETAEIDDADPEIGHFSPWSWWPIVLAGSLGVLFMGLAVGVWLAPIGVVLTLIALVGWVYEYYRGNFAR